MTMLSSSERQIFLDAAIELSRQAAQAALSLAADGFAVRFKNGRDLVTSADEKAEAIITTGIRERFGSEQHHILAEESAPSLPIEHVRDSLVWVIDPIDGTTNFAHGIPHVGISIAVAHRGEIQVGVVRNPFNGELFYAVRGGGAYVRIDRTDEESNQASNARQLRVSETRQLDRALVATGFPTTRGDPEPYATRVKSVLRHCFDLRRLGAASLDICYVAAGRLDAFYENLSPWDIAAARLIAVEAGARTGRFQSLPGEVRRANEPAIDSPELASPDFPDELSAKNFVVTNGHLHDSFLAILLP